MKTLIELKNKIEKMKKINQLHILKIFYDNNCEMSENSNGVFINLIYIKPNILKKINNYIDYLDLQENNLNKHEIHKKQIKNEYILS